MSTSASDATFNCFEISSQRNYSDLAVRWTHRTSLFDWTLEPKAFLTTGWLSAFVQLIPCWIPNQPSHQVSAHHITSQLTETWHLKCSHENLMFPVEFPLPVSVSHLNSSTQLFNIVSHCLVPPHSSELVRSGQPELELAMAHREEAQRNSQFRCLGSCRWEICWSGCRSWIL